MSNHKTFQKTPLVAAMLVFSMAFTYGATAMANDETDAQLVERLQRTEDQLRTQMPGLSAEEIKIMRRIYDEQEAARQNPSAPMVNNRVTMLEKGESPQINIMERFDTTLIFADRHGKPIEITAFRISDDQAAVLVPLHGDESSGSRGSRDGQPITEYSDPDGNIVTGSQLQGSRSERKITGLIVTPESAMRSTNITVMLRGQSFPVVLSLSTKSSRQTSENLAYIQEMRLSWVSLMPKTQEYAGKFGAGSDGELTSRMVSLVQGVPDADLQAVELEGIAETQVSLWKDETRDEWYMRLAEHIEPWNIAIKDRTNDGLRGFSIIRLDGEPPKIIGLSVNGRYTTVSIK